MVKKYSNSYKRHAIELLENCGSPKQVAIQLDMPLKTLEKWITIWKRDNNAYKENYMTKDERIYSLEKENRILKKDLELLKKTFAFTFSPIKQDVKL